MTKTVKSILRNLSNTIEWCVEPQLLSRATIDRKREQEALDQALKELEAIHQQEIAKARIHELQGVLSWNVDAKTNLKVASTITVYKRIAELSQTLKEHKVEGR